MKKEKKNIRYEYTYINSHRLFNSGFALCTWCGAEQEFHMPVPETVTKQGAKQCDHLNREITVTCSYKSLVYYHVRTKHNNIY